LPGPPPDPLDPDGGETPPSPGGGTSVVLPPLPLPPEAPPLVVPPLVVPPLVVPPLLPPPLVEGEPSGLKSEVEPPSPPAPGGGQLGLKSPKTLHV